MKKFYSLAIAALVAVSSVSAEGLKQLSLDKSGLVKSGAKVEAVKIASEISNKSINSAEPKEIDITDISGSYSWSCTSMLSYNDGSTVTSSVSIAKVSGNNYTVTWQGLEFGATFSMLSQTLSIAANQDLGYNEYNQIQVYLYHLGLSGNNLTVLDTPITATIDGDKFVVDAAEIIGIGNVEVGGWFVLGNTNVFAQSVGVEWNNPTMPVDGWVGFGTGTFADSWQVAAFGVDINEYAWTVSVEKNENVEGLYRMVNPYKNSPISSINTDPTGEGYIVFCVADPEFVTVYPYVYSGLKDDQGTYLNTNPEGYYTIAKDKTKEEIISGLGITPSTFDAITGKVTFRNCRFGTIDQPDKLIRWLDQDGNPIDVEGSFQFHGWTGINGISVDNENAPVEYYNLQGMRISNVENNPGLYIRKQGDKATKVFVK